MTMETYHVIDLPDGTTTKGQVNRRQDPAYFGLDDSSLLKGARVIDVGAFDGVWSFWAEKTGVGYVLATDVEKQFDYDWGWAGPPAQFLDPKSNDHATSFQELKNILGSSVDRKKCSCYELSPDSTGMFDLVICYGLIYHLRHPLLAFDRLRAICKGAILVESHVPPVARHVPYTCQSNAKLGSI